MKRVHGAVEKTFPDGREERQDFLGGPVTGGEGAQGDGFEAFEEHGEIAGADFFLQGLVREGAVRKREK
jgi:hypothetical protein